MTKTLHYYGFARTADKKSIALLLVTREGGRQVSQEPTGETWPDTMKGFKAAGDRCWALNVEIARSRAEARP